MCRSANYESSHSQSGCGHHHHEDVDPLLKVTGFYVHLGASDFESNPIPDSLTLLLYPPLTNCNNNKNDNISEIPSFSPPATTTVSLHRIQLPTDQDLIVFGTKQKLRAATQVLSFQLYVGEAKLLKGAIIRKNEDNHHHVNYSLNLELCKSELIPRSFSSSISEVELWVALDGHVAVGDKVTIEKPVPMSNFKKKMSNNKHRTNNKSKLEDIPEETEFRVDDDVGPHSNQEIEEEEEEAAIHLEMDLEVLRKALDMGIWVLCLGLGFMVSKASVTNFRPPPTFS